MTQPVSSGMIADAEPYTSDRGFFGHPRGLSTLFFTEMWERFSYYGIRPLLVLFMTAALADGGFAFSREAASAVRGIYAPAARLAAPPGGGARRRRLCLRARSRVGDRGHLCLVGVPRVAAGRLDRRSLARTPARDLVGR